MTRLTGWVGLGSSSSGDTFTEFSGYDRAHFYIGGDPLTGRIERFAAPTAPAGAAITHGALFDSAEGPRALLIWRWLEPCPLVPAAGWLARVSFQPIDVVVQWTTPVLHALNASLLADAADRVTIDRGTVLGTFNGQALTAACKLAAIGGTLVARAAAPRTRGTAAA